MLSVRGRPLVAGAVLLAFAAALLALFLPTGTEETADSTGTVESRSTSLWSEIREGEEDEILLALLFVPAALALGALALDTTRAARAGRIAAAVLLSAFAVVTGLSVGFFFLPAAAAMVAAAVFGPRGSAAGL